VPSGLSIVIVAATTQHDSSTLKAGEAAYLLNTVAARTKDTLPTFIAADLNFDANTNDPLLAATEALLVQNTNWLTHSQACANDEPAMVFANSASGAGDWLGIHLLLVNGAASFHVTPRGSRLDPTSPVVPPVTLSPTAGWIPLPGIVHPMLEVEFSIQ
jgi:hypothetical protein